ncbi:EF-Tu/IF-2/RF-3 family GTPase, partial [Enterobacter hormaechei]|uniref:EF-Tu/IF-2/RF-3 family GTPase n=1 Tax=Enterobacter hormaechei TaxID=158836 RepID=UPI0034D43905
FPYLPFDRVFARPGFGAVVTGTLRRGTLSVGDRLAVMPGGPEAVVRGLQIHGQPVQRAVPGRRTAVRCGVSPSATSTADRRWR